MRGFKVFSSEKKNSSLAYRISYRYQKKKLNELNNSHHPSQHLYSSVSKMPEDRSKMTALNLKREEIERQNDKLKYNIEKMKDDKQIKSRRGQVQSADARNQNMHRPQESRRYTRDDSEMKEVSPEDADETFKCFIPHVKQKPTLPSQPYDKKKCMSSVGIIHFEKYQVPDETEDNADQHPQQEQKTAQRGPALFNHELSCMIRPDKERTHEVLYSEPQKQPCRVVTYKRTIITAPFHSYLVEFSLISKRLLVVAYGMGLATENFRLMLDKKKTKDIIEDVNKDFEKLWSRVSIDANGIKIIGKVSVANKSNQKFVTSSNENEKQAQSNQLPNEKLIRTNSRRYQIQQDFLHRNYYQIVAELKDKMQQENKRVQQRSQSISTPRYQSKQLQEHGYRVPYYRAKLQKTVLKNNSIDNQNLKNDFKVGQNNHSCRNSILGIKSKQKEGNSIHRRSLKWNTKPCGDRPVENSNAMNAGMKNSEEFRRIKIQFDRNVRNAQESYLSKRNNQYAQNSINVKSQRAIPQEHDSICSEKQNKSFAAKESSDVLDEYSQGEFEQSHQKESSRHSNESISHQSKANSKSGSNSGYQQEFEAEEAASEPIQDEQQSSEQIDEENWQNTQLLQDKAAKRANINKNESVQYSVEVWEQVDSNI